jgi:biotin transporter BioY
MKLNQQLLQINRNFIICFIASASLSAVAAQLLTDYDNYLTTTITIIIGYVIYFGLFSSLFYIDNRKRYKSMESKLIKKELLTLVSSFGIGEVIYLGIRWPSLYYFLEIGIEPYLASIISEVIATACYMISVTVFLRKTKTY